MICTIFVAVWSGSVMSSVWIRHFHVKTVIPVLQDSVEHEKRRVGIVAREPMYKWYARVEWKRQVSSQTNPSIFTRFPKFFRLGLSKKGIFLSKTYFSYLTNNRKWTGKQKQHYIALVGQLPGKAFWLMSNYNQISLSDYPCSGLKIEGVSPKSRHTFMPTLNTSNSRTTTKAFLIYNFYDFTVWKRGIKKMYPEFVYVCISSKNE